jgi:hypothetical protein
MDGAIASDGGTRDAFVIPPDGGEGTDAGRGLAQTCEACDVHGDCASGYCIALTSGGSACLPDCVIDLPSCPARFECVMSAEAIPEPVCAPVGERCCVDEDGDLFGGGVGCFGIDCDDADPDINGDGVETCDGIDENCDGTIDDGDPAILCPRGTHVAVTACLGGACTVETCEPGFEDCNGLPEDGCEVDIESPTACGGCDGVCALAHVAIGGCDAGTCTVILCEDGFGDCNGIPADGCEQPLTTNTHCGGCATLCALPSATSSCETGTCEIVTCDRNWGDCDMRSMSGCETPLTSNTDCGDCGMICAPASGTGDCSSGTCRVTTCASGFEDCNMSTADGCETSIRTLTNCGACGESCTFPNAVASCSVGVCTLVECLPGFGNCDGVTSNGCETRVNTATSCGACGVPCAPSRATGDCSSGMCAITTCDSGWADCDGSVANGCETSLRSTTDCGSCGTPCLRSGAIADCTTGTCHIGSCVTGFADCDGIDATGCETSIRTVSDCGGCGLSCARAHATSTCASGVCGISTCESGFANCDGVDANGCETSLHTLTSCGGCGIPCMRANATSDCSTGTCGIGTCNPGFADCDGLDANGCETPLNSLSNCGDCGVICALSNAGETCATGTCTITSCASNFGDCDASDETGCETSLRTLTDCGGCGIGCARSHATPTCSTGTCSVGSCDPGFGNCDGSDLSGCEAPLTTLTNCGGCGTSCDFPNASESCATGSCVLGACAPGFGDCDGSDTNGCETPLTTLANCSACGMSCELTNASETWSTGS